MTKKDEKLYFSKIGQTGVDFTLNKPFSDPENLGSLLSDMAAIFSLMPKTPVEVADLGCGSGWTSNFYALAGHKVTGIDISKPAIDAANGFFKRENLTFVCSDFDKMKFRDKFDVAIFSDSLHHTDDESETLKSVYSILKPGGMIIICEPGTGHSKSVSSIEAKKIYSVTERDMPPKLSKKALKNSGFKNIKSYAHPARLHRVNYKQFSNNKKILNHTVPRTALSLAFSSFMKNNHGIVTASK
ncbi:MAG: class I SAM-dependent methyltransferase [Candidatus Saccharibacteria bacterium]|nr:class I SAM-dependent methyltransferase [Candidatus Saccharibacteria bacterium]